MIFGITPFETISVGAIVALVLLYLFSYLLRGVIGFGSATPAILGGVWIVPTHDAVILATLTSLAAPTPTHHFSSIDGKTRDSVRELALP